MNVKHEIEKLNTLSLIADICCVIDRIAAIIIVYHLTRCNYKFREYPVNGFYDTNVKQHNFEHIYFITIAVILFISSCSRYKPKSLYQIVSILITIIMLALWRMQRKFHERMGKFFDYENFRWVIIIHMAALTALSVAALIFMGRTAYLFHKKHLTANKMDIISDIIIIAASVFVVIRNCKNTNDLYFSAKKSDDIETLEIKE